MSSTLRNIKRDARCYDLDLHSEAKIIQHTEAAYSSSSLVKAASSSDFFSKVNHRSSATRGRRDGKVADEVAIFDVLKLPRNPSDTSCNLHMAPGSVDRNRDGTATVMLTGKV